MAKSTSKKRQKRLSPLGRKVTSILKTHNMAVSRFAAYCNLPGSTVHDALQEGSNPKQLTLEAIADGLERLTGRTVSLDSLTSPDSDLSDEEEIDSRFPPTNGNTLSDALLKICENLLSLVGQIDRNSNSITKDMTCQFKKFIDESLTRSDIKSQSELDTLIREVLPLTPTDALRLRLICENRLEPEIKDLPRLAILLSAIARREVTQQELVDLINADCDECLSPRQLQL